MKLRALSAGLLGCGLVVATALVVRRAERPAEAAPGGAASTAPARAADPDAVPVLVELFTSEGCSSCPPADATLARLERAQPVSGAQIVPLALHVDYWDGLGWPDPFGAPAWTARQRGYAAAIGGGVYTPEAVVDGRAQMTGSRGAALEAAVAEAAKRAHAKVAIEVARRDGAFEVTVRAGALPAAAGAASSAAAEAVVALTQDRARVAVPRGENAGETLEHTAVARELRVLGAVPAAGATLRTTWSPPRGLAPEGLHVVAFVQERATRRVLGAATRPLVR